MLTEEIHFCGHKNVRSNHPRTIEITKESNLTLKGDCIIGVSATKSCADLTSTLKDKLRNNLSAVEINLIVEPYCFKIRGIGNNDLPLTNSHDVVLRKSNFICNRTLCVGCNVGALEIPRKMVELLKDPLKQGMLVISVE